MSRLEQASFRNTGRGLALAVLAGAGCLGAADPGATPADDLGAQIQGLVSRGTYWPNPHLDVCFKTPDTTVNNEIAVRQRYETEVPAAFARYTNVEVQTHGQCGDGPDQYNWVRLELRVRGPGDRASSKTPDQLDFGGYGTNAIVYLDDSLATWVHELTHSAGFHHAQDTLGSPCTAQPGQTGNGRSLGPYDPFSLMNYCYERAPLGEPAAPRHLSDLDQLGFDMVYGTPGELTYGADGTVFRHRTVPGSAQDVRCTVQDEVQRSAFNGLHGAPAGSADDHFRAGGDHAEGHRAPPTLDLGACAYPPGFYSVAGQLFMVVGDQIAVDPASNALTTQGGSVCRVVNRNQQTLFGTDILTHVAADTTNLWLGRGGLTMATTPSCTWGDGFYLLDGDPTVFRLSGSQAGGTATACRVTDPGQLAALQRVGEPYTPTTSYQAVAPWHAEQTTLAQLVTGRTFAVAGQVPACAWPDGNYRWGSDLYQVTAGKVCHEQGAEQAQLLPRPDWARDVTNDPRFFADSTYTGECGWPAGLYQQGAAVYAIGNGVTDHRLPHYDPAAVYHSDVDPIGDICRLVGPAQQTVYANLAPRAELDPVLFTRAATPVAATADLSAQRVRPNATGAVPACPWLNADYRRFRPPGAPLYTLRKTGVNKSDGSINYDCRVRSDLAPGQPAPSAVASCAGAAIGSACIASEALDGFGFGYASICGYADDQATPICLPYGVPDEVATDLWQCPIDPASAPLTATCSTTPCGSASTITVSFRGMQDVPHGFIALAPAGQGNAWYLGRQDLNGLDHGTLTFASPGPGTWTVRALAPQGNGEFTRRAETAAFTVTAPVNGLIHVACGDAPCTDASTLTVSYANAPTANDPLHDGYTVAIAPPGVPLNQFLSYAYSQPPTASLALPAGPDRVSGNLHSAAAAVVARLTLRDSGQFLSESTPLAVLPNLQATCSGLPCVAGETVTVSYLHLPADAWIEIAPAGTAAPTSPVWALFLQPSQVFTNGAATGSVAIPVQAGWTGGWIARAYRYSGMIDTIFGLQRGYSQTGGDSAPINLGP